MEGPSEMGCSHPPISTQQTSVDMTTMDNLQSVQTVIKSVSCFEQTLAWEPFVCFTYIYIIPHVK